MKPCKCGSTELKKHISDVPTNYVYCTNCGHAGPCADDGFGAAEKAWDNHRKSIDEQILEMLETTANREDKIPLLLVSIMSLDGVAQVVSSYSTLGHAKRVTEELIRLTLERPEEMRKLLNSSTTKPLV